jgi:hypothetical protein
MVVPAAIVANTPLESTARSVGEKEADGKRLVTGR